MYSMLFEFYVSKNTNDDAIFYIEFPTTLARYMFQICIVIEINTVFRVLGVCKVFYYLLGVFGSSVYNDFFNIWLDLQFILVRKTCCILQHVLLFQIKWQLGFSCKIKHELLEITKSNDTDYE